MLNYILITISVTVLIFICSAYIILSNLFLTTKINAESTLWGIFGDSIGGSINPILTFFSFLAILYTIFLQNKELSATREELSRAADAQEKNLIKIDSQIKAQDLLKFENTFFSFLNHHNSIIQQLTFTPPPAVVSSHGTVKHYKSEITRAYNNVFNANIITQARHYLVFEENEINHYFRLVYQILKFIDLNYPGEKQNEFFSLEQKRYSSILRASIDHRILELIAINGASTEETPSYESFKIMIEKSSFLEHLKFNHEIIFEIKKIYKPSAFGGNIYLQATGNSLTAEGK